MVPDPAPQLSGWVVPDTVRLRPAPGYEYAGFWRRSWAYVVDGLIVGVPFWIIAAPIIGSAVSSTNLSAIFAPGAYHIDPATGAYLPSASTVAAINAISNKVIPVFDLLGLAYTLVQGLYFAVLWSRRGASLGQELLNVQVRTQSDGTRISFKRAWLRVFGTFIAGLILDIGFIWAAFDKRKQGWHDKIAGTVVIKPSGPRTKPVSSWIVGVVILAILAGITAGTFFVGQLASLTLQ